MTRERFVQLATAEQEPLRRFLLALCGGDRATADDLAQDTLVKAWVAADGFVERHRFRTWLFKIGHRTFLDHVRRAARMTADMEAAAKVRAPERADGAFDHEELYHAIGLLTPSVRAAVVLHYIEGYSAAEVARITGSSPLAVMKALQRGRDQLKKTLRR